MKHKVFVDSDVIISSLISIKGAAHLLLSEPNKYFFYSNIQTKELKIVCDRLKLSPINLISILKNISQIGIKSKVDKYQKFVNDKNDAHIVAGADTSKSKFIVSYNIKDFKTNELKDKLNIIVLTPALYLQYTRSLSNLSPDL